MVVFCTDLDNTIIYSYKHDIGDRKRNVELYQGREISFITDKTYDLLRVIKNNIIIKGEIIKNKIDIAFFTENKKEFKEQCEKMRSIIKFLPKKSRKEITFNMTIKEAIIDKDV